MSLDPNPLDNLADSTALREVDGCACAPVSEGREDEGAPGWQRTLYVMWFAQLIAILGFSFVIPFLPFYLRDLGVTEERLVRLWAGTLSSATMLPMVFFAPFWGRLADRYGRRPMVLRSMLGGAAVLALMALVTDVYQLLALRVLQGILTGTIGASVAMVSGIVPHRRMGSAMGLMSTAVFAGSSAGPWLGGLFADEFGYRAAFVLTGGMLFLAALLIVFLTREQFVRPDEEASPGSLRLVAALPGFATLLGIIFLVNLAGTLVGPLFSLFVESVVGPGGKIASTAGLLMAISAGMAALSATALGRLSDRIGHKRTLVGCTLLVGLSILPHALVTTVGQLYPLRFLVGLASGGTGPSINALVTRLVPKSSFGRAYGLTSAVGCLGCGVGPLLGGTLAAHYGLRLPFVLMGVAMLLVAAYTAWSLQVRPAPVPVLTSQEVAPDRLCGPGPAK